MKKISAYEIALSAVACALAAIGLTVGSLSSVLLFTGYLFACFCLMIPLAKQCYWGCVLAYIGASLIALMFNGFNFIDMLPFLMFFGLHPFVNALQIRYKVNRWLAAAIKALWFDASMFVAWKFVFVMAAPIPQVDKYIIPIILVAGTAFFIVYDYMFFRCQIAVNRVVQKIIKK